VALSRGSPRVGVTHHLALWSPDVPRHAPRTPPKQGKGSATRPSGRLVRRRSPYDATYPAAMTSPEQPAYDPNATTIQPSGTHGAGVPEPTPVPPSRSGPGWGTYIITVVSVLFIAAVVIFTLQNTQPIGIKFISWHHDFNKTSDALGAAAIAGFLGGFFLGLIPWLSARRKLRGRRRSGQN
jgi:uncharacterized integral membrane protein